MIHDFEFKGAAEMPYNPTDYGLPVWKDEDHLPPQETVTAEAETTSMTAEEAKRKFCLWAEEQLGSGLVGSSAHHRLHIRTVGA